LPRFITHGYNECMMAITSPATNPPLEKKRAGRKVVITYVIAIILIAGSIALIAYVIDPSNYYSCPDSGCPPNGNIGMAASIPEKTACGTTVGALYIESVPITSVSSSYVTTSTLGLKIMPVSGGTAVVNVAPPANNSVCPSSGGFYASLQDEQGNVLACWSGGQEWSSPTHGACSNTAGPSIGSPITFASGQEFVVSMYGSGVVPPMAGAYTMYAYGINGATVTGAADL
jgi:hypothetical protein